MSTQHTHITHYDFHSYHGSSKKKKVGYRLREGGDRLSGTIDNRNRNTDTHKLQIEGEYVLLHSKPKDKVNR